jgi:hypothetical protein
VHLRARERAQAFFDGLPWKLSPLNWAFFFSAFFLGAAFLIALPACAPCGFAALLLIFLFFSKAGMPILETLAERPILAARTFRKRKQAARRGGTSGAASSAVRTVGCKSNYICTQRFTTKLASSKQAGPHLSLLLHGGELCAKLLLP